jgi:hypothetical protein
MCDLFAKAVQHYPIELNAPLICNEPEADQLAVALARHLSVLIPVRYSVPDSEKWAVEIVSAQRPFIQESWLSTVLGVRSAKCIELGPLAYLVGHYASIIREAKGVWTVHATVVERNGHAYILTGPQRAGKTGLALMLREDFGYSVIATNYALVDHDTNCVGGTTGLTVRRPINSLVRSQFTVPLEDDFDLQFVEYLNVPSRPIPVAGIIFLTSWPAPLRWKHLFDSATVLFEELSRLPRSVTMFMEPSVATSAFDSAVSNQRRYDFARKLARSVPVFDVAGPVREQALWFVDTCASR